MYLRAGKCVSRICGNFVFFTHKACINVFYYVVYLPSDKHKGIGDFMQNVIIDPKNFSCLVLTFCNPFPPRLNKISVGFPLHIDILQHFVGFRVRFVDLVNEQVSSISCWCVRLLLVISSKGDGDMASSVQIVTKVVF